MTCWTWWVPITVISLISDNIWRHLWGNIKKLLRIIVITQFFLPKLDLNDETYKGNECYSPSLCLCLITFQFLPEQQTCDDEGVSDANILYIGMFYFLRFQANNGFKRRGWGGRKGKGSKGAMFSITSYSFCLIQCILKCDPTSPKDIYVWISLGTRIVDIIYTVLIKRVRYFVLLNYSCKSWSNFKTSGLQIPNLSLVLKFDQDLHE